MGLGPGNVSFILPIELITCQKCDEMSGEYYCGTLNCGEAFDKDSQRLAHYIDKSHGSFVLSYHGEL
jgi:hypothetical protein